MNFFKAKIKSKNWSQQRKVKEKAKPKSWNFWVRKKAKIRKTRSEKMPIKKGVRESSKAKKALKRIGMLPQGMIPKEKIIKTFEASSKEERNFPWARTSFKINFPKKR